MALFRRNKESALEREINRIYDMASSKTSVNKGNVFDNSMSSCLSTIVLISLCCGVQD